MGGCGMCTTNSSFFFNMLYSFVYLNEIFAFKWLKFELNLIVILTLCINVTSAVKSLQLCPTLRNPIDGSPPGSPIPGILQARTLEWVAISFSNAWKWKVKVKLFSRVWLLATPWTAAYQAPPSMGFSRQEYWSGVPLPSPNVTSKASQLANFCITFVYGFCFVLSTAHSVWDFSSPMKVWTRPQQWKVWTPNRWTSGESPIVFFFNTLKNLWFSE